MNWFKFISVLIQIGSGISDQYIKNPDSKKTKDNVMAVIAVALPVIATVVEGLANQNPDGTSATVAYEGVPAKIALPTTTTTTISN